MYAMNCIMQTIGCYLVDHAFEKCGQLNSKCCLTQNVIANEGKDCFRVSIVRDKASLNLLLHTGVFSFETGQYVVVISVIWLDHLYIS